MLNHDKWGKFIHKRNFPNEKASKQMAEVLKEASEKPIKVSIEFTKP